jgi:hypothetical protein
MTNKQKQNISIDRKTRALHRMQAREERENNKQLENLIRRHEKLGKKLNRVIIAAKEALELLPDSEFDKLAASLEESVKKCKTRIKAVGWVQQ